MNIKNLKIAKKQEALGTRLPMEVFCKLTPARKLKLDKLPGDK